MFAASFDESNLVLSKPEQMSHEQCDPLSVWHGTDENGLPVIVSCWKPTAEELEEILRHKRVWLFIYGHVMPPAAVGGCDPFAKSREKRATP